MKFFESIPPVEEMTPELKKAYTQTSLVRKISMFIGFTIAVVVFVAFSVGYLKEGIGRFFQEFFNIILYSMVLGGIFHGWLHCEFFVRHVKRKVLFPIRLVPYFLVYIFGWLPGSIFLIIDLILFIKKKPLVYPFEFEHICRLEKVEQELEAVERKHNNDMDKLRGLKQMYDNGVITQEEFESKKAELLERI